MARTQLNLDNLLLFDSTHEIKTVDSIRYIDLDAVMIR